MPGEGKGKGKGPPEEGKPAEAKTEGIASKDGKRKIRMNEKGKCEVCASPCDEVRRKYASVMTPEAEAKIKLIEENPDLTNPMKEEALKPVEQELADLLAQKIASVKGPYSNIADGTKV